MSPYGEILRPHTQLASKTYSEGVTIHHLSLSRAKELGLIQAMYAEFKDEVENGLTYPQEECADCATFEAYFFGGDVFVAVNGGLVAENITGFYYIKPNYPGRSSHICNAGFVVVKSKRGQGIGKLLAQSFLEYAKELGYRASIFNLVYVNNEASVRLWDGLGFERVGRIPDAGRVREPVRMAVTEGTATAATGTTEKPVGFQLLDKGYVDALIYHKRL